MALKAVLNKATIKATGETLVVYKLRNENYHDYHNMGVNFPATSKLNKKEFKYEELVLGESVEQ